MSFISSTFSNLTINVGKGLANTGVNAAFYAANYRKRDGQLKFISNRGYSNVFVYAAKRTMMQMTFATINDLYPKYIRQLDRKNATAAYQKNQGQELQKIITNGQKADEDTSVSYTHLDVYKRQPLMSGSFPYKKVRRCFFICCKGNRFILYTK